MSSLPSPVEARAQALAAASQVWILVIDEIISRRIAEGYFDADWVPPFTNASDNPTLEHLLQVYKEYAPKVETACNGHGAMKDCDCKQKVIWFKW